MARTVLALASEPLPHARAAVILAASLVGLLDERPELTVGLSVGSRGPRRPLATRPPNRRIAKGHNLFRRWSAAHAHPPVVHQIGASPSECSGWCEIGLSSAGKYDNIPDFKDFLAATYSRGSYTTTTIGNAAFDVRVRNGIGSFHSFVATKKKFRFPGNYTQRKDVIFQFRIFRMR